METLPPPFFGGGGGGGGYFTYQIIVFLKMKKKNCLYESSTWSKVNILSSIHLLTTKRATHMEHTSIFRHSQYPSHEHLFMTWKRSSHAQP